MTQRRDSLHPSPSSRVLACTWKADGGGFRVWVTATPQVVARGATFAEADEALYAAILKATGDGENAREYSPAAPRAPRPDGIVGGPTYVFPAAYASSKDDVAALYTSICPQCSYPTGVRTDVPLSVKEIPPNVDACRVNLGWPTGTAGRVVCVSEEFLGLLSEQDRSSFTWQVMQRPARQRRRFFELVRGAAPIPFVARAGVPREVISRCGTCGVEDWPYHKAGEEQPALHVPANRARFDVGQKWAALERRRRPVLGTTPDEWSRLVGQKGARGLRSQDVGVLEADYIDPAPSTMLRSILGARAKQGRTDRSR